MPVSLARWRSLVPALAIALAPMAANAQAVGGAGGGGSVFGQVISWIQSNIVTDMITIAVVAVGLGLMFTQHFNWRQILGICGGAWIVLNAATVVGLL